MYFYFSDARLEYEVKKSRFITYVFSVENKAEFRGKLAEVKARYPDARHWVSVCLIGSINQPKWLHLDDDGEPSGTAAKPILNVFQHNNIVNSAAVVVRYFGGIKLGAGGLVRAYSASVAEVVKSDVVRPFIQKIRYRVRSTFEEESQLRHVLNQIGVMADANYLASGVCLKFECTEDEFNLFKLAYHEVMQKPLQGFEIDGVDGVL